MRFEEALVKLRAGLRLSNEQWAPGTYIVLQRGYPKGVPINRNTAAAIGEPEGTVKVFRPYLMLHTGEGEFVPYVPSQADILGEDWNVAPDFSQATPAVHVNRCMGDNCIH